MNMLIQPACILILNKGYLVYFKLSKCHIFDYEMETKADQRIYAHFSKHIIIKSDKSLCKALSIGQQMYAEGYYCNPIVLPKR